MKKIIIIPAIILLVCCVTVGAFNVVLGSANRPMTFYEAFVALSNIEFSFDEIQNLLYTLSDLWSPNSSTYPSMGGSSDDTGGGGSRVEAPFGSPNYKADSGYEWLDSVLDFLSNCISTFYIIIQFIVLLIKDTLKMLYMLFDIITKFVIGVPKTPA